MDNFKILRPGFDDPNWRRKACCNFCDCEFEVTKGANVFYQDKTDRGNNTQLTIWVNCPNSKCKKATIIKKCNIYFNTDEEIMDYFGSLDKYLTEKEYPYRY